jgi:hypothetical protein
MQYVDNSYIAFRSAIKLLRMCIGDGTLALDCPFLPLLQFHPHFFKRSLTVTPPFLKNKIAMSLRCSSQIRHEPAK